MKKFAVFALHIATNSKMVIRDIPSVEHARMFGNGLTEYWNNIRIRHYAGDNDIGTDIEIIARPGDRRPTDD